MCVIIPEPLGRSMTPSNYWEAARATVKSMLGDEMRPGAGSGAYQVDGRSTYRAVVDGPMPQLVYVYTEDETAYVVSCNAQRPHFDGLVASFDAIGQSLELGGSD